MLGNMNRGTKIAIVGFYCLALSALCCLAPVAQADRPLEEQAGDKPVTALVIRSVSVEIVDIFDGQNLTWFHEAVNKIKSSTKGEVIKRELLFREGDVFDQFLVEESERNLRSLRFLRNVTIVSIIDGDYVDIVVSAQDTWTLFLQTSVSSGGGTNKASVGLAERNLLGFGKRLEALYADDEGRQTFEGYWKDPRIWGTKEELEFGHFERTDGNRTFGAFSRPYRGYEDPLSWRVSGDYYDVVGRMFENGEENFIYGQLHKDISAQLSLAYGDPQTVRTRVYFGYDYLSDHFSPPSAEDYGNVDIDPRQAPYLPEKLAQDRLFSGPSLGWQVVKPEFLSLSYIDAFGREEDFNLGNDLLVRSIFALEGLGSARDTLLLNVSNIKGWRLGPRSFVRGELLAATRLDGHSISNTVIRTDVRYYNVLGGEELWGVYFGKHTLCAALRSSVGFGMDRDTQFVLGAAEGLRGYEDRAFTGNSRLVLNLEDRFHLVEDIFKIVDLGGAFFLDVGGASARSFGSIFKNEMFADFGFGLRLGLPRASGGSVLRIDVAFPLRDGEEGSSQLEPRILFTSGQLFSSRLYREITSPGTSLVFAP